MSKFFLLCLTFILSSYTLVAAESKGVHFASLHDGAVVTSPLQLGMVVQGMTLAKAGELEDGTGHFHIIIDGGFVPNGVPVAKDAQHLHFGKAQQTASLILAKGAHRLTLQLADAHHVSYGKAWSQTVHVTVK
ncbi:MAG: DUF4399 domain-containing protein [Mariprofundaceae bacterium]